VTEEAKYPNKSSESSKDGTHSHTLLSACVSTPFLGILEPEFFMGQTMTDHDDSFVVDPERCKRVKVAIGYIKKRVHELGGTQKVKVTADISTDLDHFGIADCGGTFDVCLESDSLIEVIDYKDGRTPVAASNDDGSPNEQLEQYLFGKMASLKRGMKAQEYPWKRAILTIIQPRMIEPISSHQLTIEEALNRLCNIMDEVARVNTDEPEYVPTESGCQWCRAKGNCSAFASMAASKLGQVVDVSGLFKPINDTQDTATGLASQLANTDPTKLTDQQLVKLYESESLVTSFFKSTKEELQRRLEAGQRIDGVKLVNGRGSRTWAVPEDEMASKLKRMGVPKDVIYPTSFITIPQLEKATWDKKDGTKGSLTAKQLELIDAQYTSRVVGKPVLTFESDERKEVITDVSHLFKAVEPQQTVVTLPDWLK
jgi:hypothetical protein